MKAVIPISRVESEKADMERVNAFDQLVGGRSGTAPVV